VSQCPCGIAYASWAYGYAKFHTAKPIQSVAAVVLDNGTLPIIPNNAFVMKDYGAVKVFLMYLLLILIVILLNL
jgi:hypothetical protein